MSLLPPNATALELALEATAARAARIDVPIRDLWSAETCPAWALPYLAMALSVDVWDETWDEATQRRVIAASAEVHRHKGTRAGVQAALAAEGYGDAVIVEDRDLPRIGGDWLIGDMVEIGPTDPHWADYWVELQQAVPGRAAARLRDRLTDVAPVRCRLRSVDLVGAYYTIGDGLWDIGSDIAVGNTYTMEA